MFSTQLRPQSSLAAMWTVDPMVCARIMRKFANLLPCIWLFNFKNDRFSCVCDAGYSGETCQDCEFGLLLP